MHWVTKRKGIDVRSSTVDARRTAAERGHEQLLPYIGMPYEEPPTAL